MATTKNKSKAALVSAAPSLNMYKKIAVIRQPSDSLTYEDAQGNQKSVSIQELGDAISSATPLQAPKPKLDIPVPRINAVEGYERDVPATFDAPLSFVRYHRPTVEEWKESVEYVADAEDESWLDNNTKFGDAVSNGTSSESAPLPQLPQKVFEHMLDLLEKETGFESIITTNQAETLFHARIPHLYILFPSKPRQGVITVKHVINDVYHYWVQKRSKLKRPLLRRFWPVTSTEDTNPHLVFRPREKEKYKLRKKRQNDSNSYRKMKQLRDDFDNLRAALDLVRKREEIHRLHVKLQVELFQQRQHDIIDTSNRPRQIDLRRNEIEKTLEVPKHFDLHVGGRISKRARLGSAGDGGASSFLNEFRRDGLRSTSSGASGGAVNVAGRNQGEPAPNFLHPLATRERYVTSWDGAVPHVPTYADAKEEPTFSYRHRPRIGRGGRVCIDRLPLPRDPNITPVTVYKAGFPMKHSLKPKERLLDLLPQPLDYAALTRKIEKIAVAAIKEDHDARVVGTSGDGEENDGDEHVVKLDEWLDTDEQVWGEERYSICPI